jgi:MOSC domain-containing protein YiiM
MIGVEVCDRCGFERAEWNEQDAQRTLLHADDMLNLWSVDATGHLDRKLQARRLDDLKAIAAADDLFDKVHHLMHGLCSIADVRRAAGDAVSQQRGTIAQISRSGGGVPKLAIDAAAIGRRGVDGDVQHTRVHHGRPWQALCLWSSEVIDALAAAGHPITPGAAGENITISGVDWSTLRGGTIVDIGEVRCQLSAPAVPCSKNAQWFTGGDISLIDHSLHPGQSRWYASVLRPGSITTGDPVTISPVSPT